MNTDYRNEQTELQGIIRNCKYPHQRMFDDIAALVGEATENKYLRAGAGLAAVGLVYAVGGESYAQDVAAEAQYGFLAGCWDGMLVFPNIVLDILGADSTLASDGNGVRSTLNTGAGYWLGFYMTAGAEGTIFGAIGGSSED